MERAKTEAAAKAFRGSLRLLSKSRETCRWFTNVGNKNSLQISETGTSWFWGSLLCSSTEQWDSRSRSQLAALLYSAVIPSALCRYAFWRGILSRHALVLATRSLKLGMFEITGYQRV